MPIQRDLPPPALPTQKEVTAGWQSARAIVIASIPSLAKVLPENDPGLGAFLMRDPNPIHLRLPLEAQAALNSDPLARDVFKSALRASFFPFDPLICKPGG